MSLLKSMGIAALIFANIGGVIGVVGLLIWLEEKSKALAAATSILLAYCCVVVVVYWGSR